MLLFQKVHVYLAIIVDFGIARERTKRETDGLCRNGHAGTADHPGGSPGQNILEIKTANPS